MLLGRPVLYGLAVGGSAGVQKVLTMLQRELELAMALSGCTSLQDIGPQLLLRRLVPVTAAGGSASTQQHHQQSAAQRSRL